MSTLVSSARLVGHYPHPTDDGWVILGQDGGQSIDLGGATLFVFSDTLLASADDHGSLPASVEALATLDVPTYFLANCAAVCPEATFREAVGAMRFYCDEDGYPTEVLAATPAEAASGTRFWPEHGCRVGDAVYLFYLGIETVDAGSVWGFRNRGVGLAVIDPGTGSAQRVRRDGDWRLWTSSADDFHLGVQVIRRGDWIYTFGSRRHGMEVTGLVARAPLAAIGDPGAYRFLGAGGVWVGDVASAASLGPAGSDFSVSFNEHLGAYVMVYVDSYSKDMMLRVADDVVGPYSAPERIGRVPHERASDLVYLAFEHPAFAADGGALLTVSYSQPYFTMNNIVEVRLR